MALNSRNMEPDDEICLCFHVTKRKIVNYLKRENPPVASLISECLGAGTGCGWCVPYLRMLHAQHEAGELNLDVAGVTPESYAEARARFRQAGERDADSANESESNPE